MPEEFLKSFTEAINRDRKTTTRFAGGRYKKITMISMGVLPGKAVILSGDFGIAKALDTISGL